MRVLPAFCVLLACVLSRAAQAQLTAADSVPRTPPALAQQLVAFDSERLHHDRQGMTILGGWAAGNLLVSGLALGSAEGSARYFHQMNLGWGAVNAALAGISYLAARPGAASPAGTRAASVRSQMRTENIYLLNTGLDVAYLAAGVYLLEKSHNPAAAGPPERWRGYGQSLLLQGGFLLLFDGLQYATHHRHAGRALYPLLSRVRLGPAGIGLSVSLTRAGRAAL